MIKTANLSQLNNQRGSVGLEFTIIFPLLLMVTFGIIEFGALMFDKAIVTNAAREAARAVVAFDYDGTDDECSDLTTIRTNAQNVVDRWMRNNFGNGNLFLINFDPQTPNITVDPPVLDPDTGEYMLVVTVEYRFHFVFIDHIINLLFNGALSDGIPLDAEVKMRGEDQSLLTELVEQGCI
jgi:Flp pilus assembly protein TadG